MQTGFQAGMETILGVQDNKKAGTGALASLSEDTIEADLQSDSEANDKARNRYHRLFWEPVPEGKVCSIFPLTSAIFHTSIGTHHPGSP